MLFRSASESGAWVKALMAYVSTSHPHSFAVETDLNYGKTRRVSVCVCVCVCVCLGGGCVCVRACVRAVPQ